MKIRSENQFIASARGAILKWYGSNEVDDGQIIEQGIKTFTRGIEKFPSSSELWVVYAELLRFAQEKPPVIEQTGSIRERISTPCGRDGRLSIGEHL